MKTIILLIILLCCLPFLHIYYLRSKFQVKYETALPQFNESGYNLPKIVWCFWDKQPLPPIIETITNNWKKLMPDWTFHILSNETLHNFIDIPFNISHLNVAHQTDIFRLHLLEKYGGVWMDCGIIVNDPTFLNQKREDCIQQRSQMFIYDSPFHQTNPDYKVVENWFIMAPLNSPFIKLWRQEHDCAVKSRFFFYKWYCKYILGVDNQKINRDIFDVYLTQHLCAQVVMQKNPDIKNQIIMEDSRKTMFYLQEQVGWDTQKFQVILFMKGKSIPVIKMVGNNRKGLDGEKFKKYFTL